MAGNLPLTLLLAGGGALVIYSGVTDQSGGPLAVIQRALSGAPQTAAHPKATEASLLGVTLTGLDPSTPGAVHPIGPTLAESAGSAKGIAVVNMARSFIGVPYVYGGSTPNGFDCSGLTQYCMLNAAGIKIPRVAAAQQLAGKAVASPTFAEPGDLVFYGSPAYHVGIVVSPGVMIDAPHTGTKVGQRNFYNDLSGIRRYT